MFKTVNVKGTLHAANGKFVPNRRNLVLEVNFIENGWQGLVKVSTDARGRLVGSGRVNGFADFAVTPQFRLRATSSPTPLSTTYQVKLMSNGMLQIDFGKIVPRGSGGGAETATLKAQVKTLSQEKKALTTRMASFDTQTARLQSDFQKQLVAKDKSIKAMTEEMAARVTTAAPASTVVASQELTFLRAQLAGKQVELERVTTERAVKDADHAKAIKERDVLKQDLDMIRTSNASAPLITDLAGSVAKSLGDAGKTADARSGFAVADAKVTLKGYLADGGQRFKPLDAAEISRANAHAASEISFNLTPTVTHTPTSGQQMPDVVGLTPASARRILRPLGNEIQLIEAAGKPAGGIVAQTPRAGQALPDDTLIRLTVATGPATKGS